MSLFSYLILFFANFLSETFDQVDLCIIKKDINNIIIILLIYIIQIFTVTK
jgi:hypothetical protein